MCLIYSIHFSKPQISYTIRNRAYFTVVAINIAYCIMRMEGASQFIGIILCQWDENNDNCLKWDKLTLIWYFTVC